MRAALLFFVSSLIFAASVITSRPAVTPVEAGFTNPPATGFYCGTGTGTSVCSTSPTLTTPNIGVASGTSLTLTQGLSAVTGLFSGTVGITGTLTTTGATTLNGGLGVSGAVTVTGPAGASGLVVNGGSSSGVPAIQANAGGSSAVGIYAIGGASNNALVATCAGAGNAISAINTSSGAAISATSTSGYGLAFSGDATSPTKSALFIGRQDANPTSGALGDMFLLGSGSTQTFRMATSATPRWDDVAAVLSTSLTNTAFAGGGQASATTICDEEPLTEISTVATTGDSVKWAASAILGKVCEVWNKGANSLNLFPPSGGSLCVAGGACLAADASTAVAATGALRCWHKGSNVWNCR